MIEGEEEPLFMFQLSLVYDKTKDHLKTKGFDSTMCYNISDVFDLDRGKWYGRGNVVNGGVLLLRR